MKTYLQHPYGKIVKPARVAQFREVKDSIATHGFDHERHPIWIYQGQVLEGWTRYCAMAELVDEKGMVFGPECFKQFEGGNAEAVLFVSRENVMRRHLEEDDRLNVAMKIKKQLEELAPEERDYSKGSMDKQAAEAAGVSEKTVRRASRVEREGSPELKQAMQEGKVSPGTAEKLLKADPKAIKKAVEKVGKKKKGKITLKEVKAATGVRDLAKRPVPKHLVKVFNWGDELDAAAVQLKTIMRTLRKASDEIPAVGTQTIMSNLTSVVSVIEAESPGWVCQGCQGEGKRDGKQCNICKGKGHVKTGSGKEPKWD